MGKRLHPFDMAQDRRLPTRNLVGIGGHILQPLPERLKAVAVYKT